MPLFSGGQASSTVRADASPPPVDLEEHPDDEVQGRAFQRQGSAELEWWCTVPAGEEQDGTMVAFGDVW